MKSVFADDNIVFIFNHLRLADPSHYCKYPKVAWMNRATGETGEADLEHADLEKLRQWYKAFRPSTERRIRRFVS